MRLKLILKFLIKKLVSITKIYNSLNKFTNKCYENIILRGFII